jgi:inner membrane protease ATP23
MSVSEGSNSSGGSSQLNQDDQQVYNKWSNYFKYKMNQLGSNESQLYETQEQEAIKRKQYIRCEKWKDQLINNSNL